MFSYTCLTPMNTMEYTCHFILSRPKSCSNEPRRGMRCSFWPHLACSRPESLAEPTTRSTRGLWWGDHVSTRHCVRSVLAMRGHTTPFVSCLLYKSKRMYSPMHWCRALRPLGACGLMLTSCLLPPVRLSSVDMKCSLMRCNGK